MLPEDEETMPNPTGPAIPKPRLNTYPIVTSSIYLDRIVAEHRISPQQRGDLLDVSTADALRVAACDEDMLLTASHNDGANVRHIPQIFCASREEDRCHRDAGEHET